MAYIKARISRLDIGQKIENTGFYFCNTNETDTYNLLVSHCLQCHCTDLLTQFGICRYCMQPFSQSVLIIGCVKIDNSQL